MKPETVEIPTPVLSSVETLDELQDWLTAQNPKIIAELRAARREDRAGKFKTLRVEASRKIDEGWEEAKAGQLRTPEKVRQSLAVRKEVWKQAHNS
ncbi:MAG TPA: hypothetical protein VGR14_20055 [Verrucomicrobiae bacterium]|nr:hypothetical protein [Verrucomicrobiae bacterium]